MRHTSKTRSLSIVLAGLALVFLVSWDFVLPMPGVYIKAPLRFDSYNDAPPENDQRVLYQNDPREPAEVLSVIPSDNK